MQIFIFHFSALICFGFDFDSEKGRVLLAD